MRIALTTLLALTSTPALAQTVLTALGGGTILEPSTGSVGTDRDGYPPSSGPADPEEGMIAFRIDVGAAILSPVAVLLDDDADGVDDLRIDEAGATPTEARRNLDNLDGALDGRLAPGSYTIYWNLN